MARRFELVEGSSAKFWEVEVDGDEMTVRYGRIGTDGQQKHKSLASPAAAEKEADKLIAQKTRKGYEEVSGGKKSAAKRAAPKKAAKKGKGKPLTLQDAVLLSEKEALEQLPLKSHLNSWGDEIRLLDGDVVVDGDLELDEVPDIWVRGDLKVKGSVCNIEGDYGPFLVVEGDLQAKNLIGGGSEIQILGNARITNTIYGHYNHGILEIGGDVTAKAVICDDHHLDIGGSVAAITVASGGTMQGDFDSDDFERVMVPEVLAPEGYLDTCALLDHILKQNKPPVRGGARPSRVIVQEEISRLASGGGEVTELDLSGKKLKEVPAALCKLATLERLNLSDKSCASSRPPSRGSRTCAS